MVKTGINGVYCVTPEYGSWKQYETYARQACSAGADAVQLRAKKLALPELVKAGRSLRRVTRRARKLFIVNDSAGLAFFLGADGVHLGQGDLPAWAARKAGRLLGRRKFIIGVSVENAGQARMAVKDGADYVAVGPVFPTPLKKRKALGLKAVAEIKRNVRIPVVAIGGINRGNAGSVLDAGADALAVIRAASAGGNVRKAVSGLKGITG